MPQHLLQTTIVGSLPKPSWLAEPSGFATATMPASRSWRAMEFAAILNEEARELEALGIDVSPHLLRLRHQGVFTAWSVAGILGPAIGARVFDQFHEYRNAFFIAGALAAIACLALAGARPSRPDRPELAPVHADG